MKDVSTSKLLIIVIGILLGLAMLIGGCTYINEVNNQRAIQETKIEQGEATKRTGERSQFWQKMIPWGKDE